MRVKHLIKFPPFLCLYFLYQLSKLMRRDTAKWVFGSHLGYADNSKFLFIEVIENHPEINAIWIFHHKRDVVKLRKKGFKAYHWLSLKGIYHCLTAKVYVCTRNAFDINTYTSGGAILLDLNHGVGVKQCFWKRPGAIEKRFGTTIEKIKRSFFYKVNNLSELFRNPDICLVPSYSQAERFFAPMYNIPVESCLLANYPRNEALLWDANKRDTVIRKYDNLASLEYIAYLQQFSKVYIYMPTWRDNGSDFINKAHIDVVRLNEVLKQCNSLLVFKLHPFTKLDVEEWGHLSNISLFDRRCDLYHVIPYTHCLITDYSSIYSDYVLLDKEIILYVFDKNEYLEHCHDLEDYDKYYLGKQAYNFDELIQMITDNVDCHIPQKDKDFVMRFYWDSINNGVDIVEEVKKRLH
ncbi:MAG: CDP-glycerol glycerophosphotransferase family protein [Bacteroidaceae bacterium]|nr:CDP-glycerol glycerophosphotransferase family protein [Bacteroidaceae bacterium]